MAVSHNDVNYVCVTSSFQESAAATFLCSKLTSIPLQQFVAVLHHVSVKHHFPIGNATFCLFDTEMGLFGSCWCKIHYFQFLFFKIINVSHLYGFFIAAKIILFCKTSKL